MIKIEQRVDFLKRVSLIIKYNSFILWMFLQKFNDLPKISVYADFFFQTEIASSAKSYLKVKINRLHLTSLFSSLMLRFICNSGELIPDPWEIS